MLKDGAKVWVIDEYNDAIEVTLKEEPMHSGHLYYVNETTYEYERILEVFPTKEAAETNTKKKAELDKLK